MEGNSSRFLLGFICPGFELLKKKEDVLPFVDALITTRGNGDLEEL